MSNKSLYIDAGHGGTDPGASGFGKSEKDWTLKMSIYQYNRLKSLGAKVGISRTSDKTLTNSGRTNAIKSKYTYCISNHFNAFNGEARGVEVIHSIHTSGALAQRMADAITRSSGLPFRRIFDRKGNNGDYFFMHRQTGSTTTLILEYGFIDNKKDNDFYSNEANFTRVAEAVVKEWCAILGIKYAPLIPPVKKEEAKPIRRRDEDFINDYAKEPIDWAIKNGVSSGEKPNRYATRQEVITMIKRYHEKFGK